MDEFPNFKLKFRFYRTRRATRGRKLTNNWARDGERKKLEAKIRIRTAYGKSFNRRKFSPNSIIIIIREKKEERKEIERRRKGIKRKAERRNDERRETDSEIIVGHCLHSTWLRWMGERIAGYKINMVNRNCATNAYHIHSS